MILISINFYNLEFCRFVSLHAKENERTSSWWSNGTAIICVHYLFSFFFCYFKSNWSSTKETNIKIALKCFWFSFVNQNSVDWSDFTARKKKELKSNNNNHAKFLLTRILFPNFRYLLLFVWNRDIVRPKSIRNGAKKRSSKSWQNNFVSGNTTRILRQFCFAQSSGQLRVMLCMVAYFFVLFCFFCFEQQTL